MSEKYVIASAKTAKDLDSAYADAKSESKKYGFSAVTALKTEVVSKAMTDAKKGADFVVEVDVSGKVMLCQLYCEVKGGMKSVIGRKEIKSVKEFEDATALARLKAYEKFKKTLNQ